MAIRIPTGAYSFVYSPFAFTHTTGATFIFAFKITVDQDSEQSIATCRSPGSAYRHELIADVSGNLKGRVSWSTASTSLLGAGVGSGWMWGAIKLYRSSGSPRITFYTKTHPSGSVQSADLTDGGAEDSNGSPLSYSFTIGEGDGIGVANGGVDGAYLKTFSAALSDQEIADEMSAFSFVRINNRYSYLTGIDKASVAAAVLDESGNSNNWTQQGSSVTLNDAANPSAFPPPTPPADFVVSTVLSPITLPDESPVSTTAIAVVQSAIGAIPIDAPATWAELPVAPGYNNVIVAALGGWTENPSSVTLEDSLGLTWTQRVARQRNSGGGGGHLIMWTAPVTQGNGILRVRPVVTSTLPPSVSLVIAEVARANLSTLIDGAPVSNTGTGTSVSADHANTTNANDLMVAALTYESSQAGVSSWGGGYSRVIEKNGAAAVSLAVRAVSSTGNYDPSATLDSSTAWAAGVMALRQQSAATAPDVTTTSIATQASATAAGVQLAATGSGPITWSISGAPANVSITSGGYLSWPATLADGSYTFTATATNDNGTDLQSMTLQIGATVTAPNITTTTLPDVTAGTGGTLPITITGTGPFALTTSSGTPPTGTTYAGSSIVIPSSATAGSYSWTVQATGPTGLYDTQAYTLTIQSSSSVPTIATASLAYGTVGVAYSHSLAAIGTAPITWSIVSGSLPTGLSLNGSTGAITGTPSVVVTKQVTFRASNAYGTADRSITISVVSAPSSDIASPWARWIAR